MTAAENGGAATRGPDLTLARLHLRLGSLALARAELETLAGRDALDQDGLVDLAEARWRTGDIAGAGEAASAALDDEDGPLLALVVAAEAAAARGRPTEARRLADRAMVVAAGSIDALFAGMPRAGVWPPDATAPPPSPTTMFDPPRRGSSVVHRHPRPHEAAPAAGGLAREATDEAPVEPSSEADAATIGLWEATAATDGRDQASDLTAEVVDGGHAGADLHGADLDGADLDGARDLPVGDTELDLGRAALEAGDTGEAAVRLGLVLRVSPALAPAVLELIEGRAERAIALVRGDAYRLVGREIEARRAFTEAARGGSWPPPAPEHDAQALAADGPADPRPADGPADRSTDRQAADGPAVDRAEPSADYQPADGPADLPADDLTDPSTEGEPA